MSDFDSTIVYFASMGYTLSGVEIFTIPSNKSAAYVRAQLDQPGVGRELTCIRQGQRRIPLPPSQLPAQ